MGGAESAEMDSKQKLAAAGGKTKAKKETQVKKVEGGVTTYTSATSTEEKAPVADFEAVSEQTINSKGVKTPHEPETEPNDPSKAPVEGEGTKTEVFRTVEPDGCIVTKTVKTTRRKTRSATGQLITMIEVETTTETEEPDGDTTTSIKTETTTEMESKSAHQRHDAPQKPIASSTTTATPTESVQTEVFQSQEADGSIVTKTVKTTTRTSTTASGELEKTIEVETTTETETKSGEKSTTVETETREETEVEES
ncbi:hypothetical protein F443_21324, partial [Phytophthora nicotianae P1569]